MMTCKSTNASRLPTPDPSLTRPIDPCAQKPKTATYPLTHSLQLTHSGAISGLSSTLAAAASAACSPAQCTAHGPPPAVPMLMQLCPKGSHGSGGYTTKCGRKSPGSTGVCAWSVVPPACCTKADCGREPALPQVCKKCPTGSSGSGCFAATCGVNANGTCGWSVRPSCS